ncbi:hypothetical protein AGMMS49975_27610 [Clostridia bacterium]|nr:hypothetical protein AGMMS49975_27610 [Clostridia bacterium]
MEVIGYIVSIENGTTKNIEITEEYRKTEEFKVWWKQKNEQAAKAIGGVPIDENVAV